MDLQEREKKIAELKAKRKKQVLIVRSAVGGLALVLLVVCAVFIVKLVNRGDGSSTADDPATEAATDGQMEETGQTDGSQTEGSTQALPAGTDPSTAAAEADTLAAMYDYDGAIELLKGMAGYESDSQLQAKAAEYEAAKASCVEYPLEEVTHVFYHSLVKDPARAFAPDDATSKGINQVMTTIDEFNKITQSMYDKGYVMVRLSDMVTFDENGNAVKGKIMLPPGKIPFVLSQDDVSYYHYQAGYGMADKLVLDENGEVKALYTDTDGTESIGDFDMVPLIDSFVKEHPDFSYRGAKGTLAMTGYNGVFGYRTDIDYKVKEHLLDDQKAWLAENPDFDFDKDVAEATKIADAMKANGWTFASHTWGHKDVSAAALDDIKADTEKWKSYVEPIVGPTNIIIFAFGADIGGAAPYTSDNTNGKFDYLKSQGFDIYCNVDSQKYFVQFGENFMRQGRRNLDGYRMYYDPDLVSDLFDASQVFDSARPTPVPRMDGKDSD